MTVEEVREYGQSEPTSLDGRGEAGHHRRSSTGWADGERSVPSTRHRRGPVLDGQGSRKMTRVALFSVVKWSCLQLSRTHKLDRYACSVLERTA